MMIIGKPTRIEPAAFVYYFDDSDVSFIKSEEEDPYHPLGAPDVINPSAPPIDQTDEGYMLYDDSDIYCMQSDCDSDDNEFGEDSDNQTEEV